MYSCLHGIQAQRVALTIYRVAPSAWAHRSWLPPGPSPLQGRALPFPLALSIPCGAAPGPGVPSIPRAGANTTCKHGDAEVKLKEEALPLLCVAAALQQLTESSFLFVCLFLSFCSRPLQFTTKCIQSPRNQSGQRKIKQEPLYRDFLKKNLFV